MAVQRFPLAGSLTEREPGDASDPRLLNCFQETIHEGVDENGKPKPVQYVTKRPGLSETYDNSAATTDTGRGIFNWNGTVYSVIGDEVFKGTSDIGQLITSSGRCYFDQAFDGSGLLVMHDGTNLYTINTSDTIAAYNSDGSNGATDVEALPSAFLPGIVVLDQYCFVADSQGNIHNSNVGDVTAWSGDSINMEMQSDQGKGITRYINYLVGFGDKTVELFFNAANTNGSPMDRFEGMASLIGCADGKTIANVDQSLVFVARSPKGGRFVAAMEGGFEAKRISTNAIDEILDKEGSNISNAFAFPMRVAGKNLYVLTLPTTANRTFVADLDEKKWYQYSTGSSGAAWAVMDSAELNGDQLLLGTSSGKVYTHDAEVYQDDGATIFTEIRTRKFDFGTMQNKFLYRLQPIGDLNSSSGTINIAWSDDDYQSWSTNRTVDLDNHQSWLTRLGMFKRRAFRIQHQQNLPMRLSHLEGNGRTGHYAKS